MARILLSCLLLITFCAAIESIDNHRHIHKSVKHYKVQSPITEDNDEVSESQEIKSSPSSSFPSKDKKSFQSNSNSERPERSERIAREPNQNKVSSGNAYNERLSDGRNSDEVDFASSTQPSPNYLAKYPSFQKKNTPQQPNIVNPLENIFGSAFGNSLPLRGLITNSFDDGSGVGSIRSGGILILKNCCDSFDNCRILKKGEVCGPEVLASPTSPTTKSLSPNDSQENADHEQDENISPESVNNRNDVAPEKKSSEEQPTQLSASPLDDIFKKHFGDAGLGNSDVFFSGHCCINDQCLDLQRGEVCGDANFMKRLRNKQKVDNPSSQYNGMPDLNNILNGKLNQLGFKQFGSFKGLYDDNNVISNTGNQNNAQISPKKQPKNGEYNAPENKMDSYNNLMKQFMQSSPIMYSQNGQFNDAGNEVDQYSNKPKKTIKHPNVKSTDFSDDELQQIRKQVLDKTNAYRRKHNVSPLKMDENLNNYAQARANSLKNRALQHGNDNPYGENLFKSMSPTNVGEAAVNAWYNELAEYQENASEQTLFASSNVQHLTQLLWKGSQALGVGVAKDNRGYIVVANYNPPGNYQWQFRKNLPTFTQSQIDEVKTKLETPNPGRNRWQRSGRNQGFINV